MTHPWGRHVAVFGEHPPASRCRWCGRRVSNGFVEYGLCPNCAEPPSEKRVRGKGGGKGPMTVVLKCPHNHYKPLRPRRNDEARFTRQEFRECLSAGVLPLGMIVRLEDGRIVAVCGIGKCYKQPAEQLPAQWTRQC